MKGFHGMNRRRFLLLASNLAVLFSRPADAQRIQKMPLIGVLWHAANAEEEMPYSAPFRQGLTDLGYVEGKTIAFEERFPAEQLDRYPQLAAELVGLRADVLVGIGIPAAVALQHATSTIPVVFVAVPDPVGQKLVESLAHPGANVTGLSSIQFDLAAKRVEFLKEALPNVRRVAVLLNASSPYEGPRWISAMQPMAERLQVTLQTIEARSVSELREAFSKMPGSFDAVIVIGSNLYALEKKRIAAFGLIYRVPTMMPFDLYVDDGGLMSYSQPWAAMFRHAATYVDRILRGARPSDLPVEQPTRVELVLNLQTARALGIEFPPQVTGRADRIIE
jgi:putative tryptophan/tyrosine transport system substrate-binding protein